MRKINSATPDLLLNAMPLLQEEMKVDHMSIRQLATETLGEMFAEESSNVAEKYPNIWKTWLGRYVHLTKVHTENLTVCCSRRNDKAQSLRVKWLEACVDIYKHHPESVPELIGNPNDSRYICRSVILKCTVCRVFQGKVHRS